jgi:hypothetical protein
MRRARLQAVLASARGAVAVALPALAIAAILPAGADALHRSVAGTQKSPGKASELWATVDLCNTAHHPDTIGIRGSMPGDGHPHDVMYMRFLVQSLDASTQKWANIGRSADSGFLKIGSAALTRQAGRSFQFKPTASTYTLRGLVEFQWHRGNRTVRVVTLPTTAGHTSLAGAEPKGFSAATCALP